MSTQEEKKKRVYKKATVSASPEMQIEATVGETTKRTYRKKTDPVNESTIQLEQLLKQETFQKVEIEKHIEENLTNPSKEVIGHLGEYIEEPFNAVPTRAAL